MPRKDWSLPQTKQSRLQQPASPEFMFSTDGTGHDLVTLTLNGIDQQVPNPNNLTYTLNSDCTGTYAVTGTPLTFAVFVSPNGDEITTINTDAGSSSSYPPSRRVWPK